MSKTIHLENDPCHPATPAKEIDRCLPLPSQWITWNKCKPSQQKRHGLIKTQNFSLSYTPMEPAPVESTGKHVQMPHSNDIPYQINQLADPQLWDSNFILFGINKYLARHMFTLQDCDIHQTMPLG